MRSRSSDEIVPAETRQAAPPGGPIGIELVAEMLLEEIDAIDAMRFGEAQQPAFQRHETAIDAVHLIDEALRCGCC